MKRKTLPLLALVATTLFLSACDDRSVSVQREPY